MAKSNLVTGIIFLVLSVFAYVQTFGMVSKIATDELGPAFWPKCLSVAMGILALIMIGQGVAGLKKDGAEAPIKFRSEGFARVVKISVVLVIFAILTYLVGIYVGILFMLPACMFLHGERNVKALVLLTVVMCLFIYLTFGLALRVPLPTGILFR